MIIAFLIAGSVCACAALAYAELATLIPTAGSAYTYSYTVLGELVASGWPPTFYTAVVIPGKSSSPDGSGSAGCI